MGTHSSRHRIALVSSSYHPHFGGVEEHVRHVARELADRGHEVEVWTVDRGDGLVDEVVDECRVRYLPTPLPARSAHALRSFAAGAPASAARWWAAYAEMRPDLLNIQCFGPNGIYASWIARLTRTPLVVSAHGETLMDEHRIYDRSALLRSALRRALRQATTTACSQFVADDLADRFGAADVTIVPNGVDVDRATTDVSRPIHRPGEKIMLGAGRLVPQKGFDTLLRAAAQSRNDTHLWIVGDGAERRNLEGLADALGIAQRVHFLGRRTSTEVRALMTQADAVVVPSRLEPFGIVALEAWASGTPLLATSRGGPAGFVTDGWDGLLVDPLNTPALADAMDRIIEDEGLARELAANGARTVRGYTWSRVVDHYEEVYARVVDARRSAP